MIASQDELTIPPELGGLSQRDAERRLLQSGPNRWVEHDRWAWLRDGLRILLDPMAVMLAVAAVLYLILGETSDAVVLGVALIPVLGVDVLLEARSRAALAKLAQAAEPLVDVVRDAYVVAVPVENVVSGDILVLHEGRVIAADGVVRWAANLSADESMLTGESEPQSKRECVDLGHPSRENKFFAGSVVVSGHGFGEATMTGTATQYGSIAALVTHTAPSPSPLQRRTAALVRRLGIVALAVAVGLVAVSRARGESWTAALLGAVSLAMAAIPEEFPMVLTLFLSVGAWRLASRGMLVRRLASVETLGSTTVICTDKTGTLTRGEFQLTEHVVLDPALSDNEFLQAAILACERHPADAMERAINAYADAHGASVAAMAARWELVRDYDFDSVGKHMSHVWQSLEDPATFLTAAKGAVEGVLAHSRIDPAVRREISDATDRLASRGLRVLAVAMKRMARPGVDREEDERDLVMCGLLGFQDPLRPEVPAAIDECQRAGILLKMITGDHALTAHAIAEAAGIRHEDSLIVTGDELMALAEADRERLIARASIFARITPQQKFLIVDSLKRSGAIVAMTGDGVNDAPALRRADIGIAMGRRGTDVARATADLVLLDDNFASIVATVREGRHILRSIQQAFLYLIAFHIPIIALAIVVPLTAMPLLLLPIHLVWLELIVHPVSALVFQAERAGTVMDRPPRPASAPLLPRDAIVRSSLSGALLTLATFSTYWWYLSRLGEPEARAMAVIMLVAGYQTLVFAERLTESGPVHRIPKSPMFWSVWSATTMSLALILYVPPVAHLFKVAPPPYELAATAVGLGIASVAWRLIVNRGAGVTR